MVGDNMVTRDDLVDNIIRTRSAIADVKISMRGNQDLRIQLETELDGLTLSEASTAQIEDEIADLEYEYEQYELDLIDLRDHIEEIEYGISMGYYE